MGVHCRITWTKLRLVIADTSAPSSIIAGSTAGICRHLSSARAVSHCRNQTATAEIRMTTRWRRLFWHLVMGILNLTNQYLTQKEMRTMLVWGVMLILSGRHFGYIIVRKWVGTMDKWNKPLCCCIWLYRCKKRYKQTVHNIKFLNYEIYQSTIINELFCRILTWSDHMATISLFSCRTAFTKKEQKWYVLSLKRHETMNFNPTITIRYDMLWSQSKMIWWNSTLLFCFTVQNHCCIILQGSIELYI